MTHNSAHNKGHRDILEGSPKSGSCVSEGCAAGREGGQGRPPDSCLVPWQLLVATASALSLLTEGQGLECSLGPQEGWTLVAIGLGNTRPWGPLGSWG